MNPPRISPLQITHVFPDPTTELPKCPKCRSDCYAMKTNFFVVQVATDEKQIYQTMNDHWIGYCLQGHKLTERKASKESVWEELKKKGKI